MSLKKMLICPSIDLKVELSFKIGSVTSLADVITLSNDEETTALSFSDMRVLECVTKYPDLFGLELVTLIGVPSADYTPTFEQLVWSFDKVSYDTLVVEANTMSRMQMLKEQERPRKTQGGDRPLPSAEAVQKAKVPNAIDWVKDVGDKSGSGTEQEE